MQAIRIYSITVLAIYIFFVFPSVSSAWHDETHIAIAKSAGYYKWFNACGADMAKLKAGDNESHNHYCLSNPPGRMVTSALVMGQVEKYNQVDKGGHLYGAIIASVRDYIRDKRMGRYGEYHLAFCAHYVGDLSQPLHNTLYNAFNQKYHVRIDGIINNEILDNFHKMRRQQGSRTNFWAFKNTKTTVENMMELQRGDEMIFMFGKGKDGGQAIKPETTLEISEVYYCNVVLPYYMVLKGQQSTFFEKKEYMLEKGDIILLYTDGIVETPNENGDFLTEHDLVKFIGPVIKNSFKVKSAILEVPFRVRDYLYLPLFQVSIKISYGFSHCLFGVFLPQRL